MGIWSRAASVVRNLFRRRRVEQDLDDELRAWVDLRVDEQERDGLSRADARRAALVELGGFDQVKERVRDVRAGALAEQLIQDLAYGGRAMRRHPVLTASAVLSLSLGIGASTAIFSLVDALLLRPFPVERPDQLRVVHSMHPRRRHRPEDQRPPPLRLVSGPARRPGRLLRHAGVCRPAVGNAGGRGAGGARGGRRRVRLGQLLRHARRHRASRPRALGRRRLAAGGPGGARSRLLGAPVRRGRRRDRPRGAGQRHAGGGGGGRTRGIPRPDARPPPRPVPAAARDRRRAAGAGAAGGPGQLAGARRRPRPRRHRRSRRRGSTGRAPAGRRRPDAVVDSAGAARQRAVGRARARARPALRPDADGRHPAGDRLRQRHDAAGVAGIGAGRGAGGPGHARRQPRPPRPPARRRSAAAGRNRRRPRRAGRLLVDRGC